VAQAEEAGRLSAPLAISNEEARGLSKEAAVSAFEAPMALAISTGMRRGV
jgi:hypothetical protein